MQKVVPLATKLTSFASATESVNETLEVQLKTKRIERLTERIGSERVSERTAAVAQWKKLPLGRKLAAPQGVKAPAVVCVSCDGGRMQRCDLPEGAKTHWCEMKVGVLEELKVESYAEDPFPQIPDKFLDIAKMDEMTREIKRGVPKGTPFERAAEQPTADGVESILVADEPIIAKPPVVLARDVVASLAESHAFGEQLAAHAWSLGFAGATKKAFVGDGSSTNWGIWEREFKHQKYVPILDFIHALTYVFSAAMAGRTREEGRESYLSWITSVWQGDVVHVIAELALRAVELGSPPPDALDTDPRQVIANAITYLTNQQSRMNYPSYRMAGLPITSSHIESMVKQINRRVKGSEKFWTEEAGEAMLQLRADQLSHTAPMNLFWTRRAAHATGTRSHSRKSNTAL